MSNYSEQNQCQPTTLISSVCSKVLAALALSGQWDSRVVWEVFMDTFHRTVMIQVLLHQTSPPAHWNGGGGSPPLLCSSGGDEEEPAEGMSSPPPFACTKQSGGKGRRHGDSTWQRKGGCQADAFKKQTKTTKPPTWGSGLPARLNPYKKHEEGKVMEIRRQTHLSPSEFMVYSPTF